MLFNTLALSALATTALAFPYNIPAEVAKRDALHKSDDPQAKLPLCGPETVTCRCPANSFYQTSSSYSFWPVKATEITKLSVDFLNTAWFGTSPERTEGNGTVVGAKRFLRADLPDSTKAELITEQLTQLKYYPDGGYYMKFQMADAPFWYNKKTAGKKGLLAGSWDIVDVREINGWTYMLWDIHVCFMDEYPLGGFHESGMNNLTTILKKNGKLPAGAQAIGPISF